MAKATQSYHKRLSGTQMADARAFFTAASKAQAALVDYLRGLALQ